MSQIAKIGAWFAGYIIFTGVFIIALILTVPPEVYPHLFRHGDLAGYMADFSRRSFKYRIASNDNSIVIVGPSYAADVGEADGIRNLALANTDMRHIRNQVAKVKPADTPVFFLSIMDITRQPTIQSNPFDNRLTWFFYIVKGFDFSLSGVRPKPIWARPGLLRRIEKDRMRLYRKLSDDPTSINLEPLYEMREINSKIIFVLAPIRLDNDCVAAAHRVLEAAFSQSDLHYINLSHLLDDDAFSDRYHFKKESQKVVVAALRRQISL